MSAALERRRIAKRQAAARAERKRKAAISIALNEKRKEKLKVRIGISSTRPFWISPFPSQKYLSAHHQSTRDFKSAALPNPFPYKPMQRRCSSL